MGDGGYKIRNKEAAHFVTFAVVGWVDIFTRKEYCHIVIDSLRYCQKEKGLLIHAWCLMSNHIHLIISAQYHDLSNILRDFKKYTSRNIIQAIHEHPGESRREWMLSLFAAAGRKNSRNTFFQFWQQDNHPMELFSTRFIDQKTEYVHFNPVAAGIVENPEHYMYSSARDFAGEKGLLEIVPL